MHIAPPYLTLAKAANYCGYKSAKHFWRLLREYNLPRYGPNQNRYRISDLDTWMENPEAFKSKPQPRRRSGGFTPVVV